MRQRRRSVDRAMNKLGNFSYEIYARSSLQDLGRHSFITRFNSIRLDEIHTQARKLGVTIRRFRPQSTDCYKAFDKDCNVAFARNTRSALNAYRAGLETVKRDSQALIRAIKYCTTCEALLKQQSISSPVLAMPKPKPPAKPSPYSQTYYDEQTNRMWQRNVIGHASKPVPPSRTLDKPKPKPLSDWHKSGKSDL